jgi:hypothetical protein
MFFPNNLTLMIHHPKYTHSVRLERYLTSLTITDQLQESPHDTIILARIASKSLRGFPIDK